MNTSDHDTRPRGRPRSLAADDAILRATLELLVEVGIRRTTIAAVAGRSGVARATIYLRWPSREALITAAFLHAKGRPPFALTGDLETDLMTGAEWARAIFSEPAFRAILPLVVGELLAQPRSETGLTYDQLAPNRRPLADAYRKQAPEAGLRTDVDPLLVMDLVVGGLLNRLLASGRPPTPTDVEQALDIMWNGLKATPGAVDSNARRRRKSA